MRYEIGRRVDVASQTHAPGDTVEIAFERLTQVRDEVERAETCSLLAGARIEVAPELADEAPLAVPLRELAGEVDEAPGPDERHVVRAGGAWPGQLDLQLGQTLINVLGH